MKKKKQKILRTLGIIGIIGVTLLVIIIPKNKIGSGKKIGEMVSRVVCNTHTPLLSFVNQTRQQTKADNSILSIAMKQIPLHQYVLENIGYEVATEDTTTYELIIQSEGQDENSVKENGEVISSTGDVGVEETLQTTETNTEKTIEASVAKTEFVKATQKIKTYDFSQYNSLDTVIKEFYAVDNTTMVDENQLNIKTLLQKDMRLQSSNDNVQILIYHTHSQEGFADSVQGEEAGTVVGVGEVLASILRNQYGYNVLHDKGQYDVKSRDYAYSEAAPAIERILLENPSIEVIIDLHRDGIKGDKKLVTQLNGRQTAQFMFFNGLSKTKSRGAISYLENPYIEDNLSLAFQMQVKCNQYYPGATRKIYLKGYRYNMHYRAKSLLIELGAQTNTLQEAKNACDPIAHALHMVLSGEEP